MKKNQRYFTLLLLSLSLFYSCGQSDKTKESGTNDTTKRVVKLKEEVINYTVDSTTLNSFVSYNENAQEKLPVIFIIHEWWGMNDYVKNRAKQLSKMGYFAIAVDMYGNGQFASNPEEAQKLATPFYQNPALANSRIIAAINKVKTFSEADTTKMIAIGYCFGGSMVLNAAKSGMSFIGVVSFHGGLAGIVPEKGKTKADVLVCHGAADKFVSPQEVTKFKTQMDSVGASYTFKEYAEATHAFTNPEATANGKKFNLPIAYNEKADKESWSDMITFFKKILK